MDDIATIIGMAGGVVGILSALVSAHQWWKVNKKIAMLSDASKVAETLPAWYTKRMMQDDWLFGLLTTDGRTIAITKITAVSHDAKWMDVQLATLEEAKRASALGAIADDRLSASIQISSIVAAMELQSS